jgi:uncharacterized membrane protein
MALLRRALDKVEGWRWVDFPAGVVQRRIRAVLPDGAVLRALRGERLGHPAHPAVVLLPVGAWLSAGILDLLGERSAARRLVLAGLVFAVPAIATGASEMRDLPERPRRVAYVHLVTNLTATTCYAVSYRYRSRGRTAAGQLWGTLGLVAVNAGGALGGHLAYAQGAGVGQWRARPRAEAVPAERPRERVSA